MPQFYSIRVQLGIAMIVLTVLSVTIVGLLLYTRASTIIEDKVSSLLKQSNVQSLQKIDVQLMQYDRLSLQLLMDGEIQAVLNALKDGSSKAALVKKANERTTAIKGTDSAIVGIYYVAANTELEQSSSFFTRIAEAENNEAQYESIRESGGKTVFLGLAPSINSDLFLKGKPVLVIGKQLKRLSDNVIMGSILIEIEAQAMLETMSSLKLDGRGYAYFVNTDGQIIVADNTELLNQPSLIKLSSQDSSQTRAAIDSEQYIVLEHRSPLTSWTLVTMTAVKDVMRDIAELRVWLIAIGLVLAIAGTAFSYISARRFGRPLEQLKAAMACAEKGDLSVRAGLSGKDELAQVARSFNRMLEALHSVISQTKQSAERVMSASASLSEVSVSSAAAASEFAAATTQISQGTIRQSETAETGSAKTLELGQQMRVLSGVKEELSIMSQLVTQKSEYGVTAMKDIQRNSMQSGELFNKLVERMEQLNNNAYYIEKVLEVMTELAKHTNILSINAGIEAARSGSGGKSFIVIAEEIGQLSLQTKQSIGQVAETINGIRQEIRDTNQFLTGAKPIFQNQLNGTIKSERLFGDVAASMNDLQLQLVSLHQSVAVFSKVEQELNEVVHHVAAGAQQNAASVEEMSAAADEQLNGAVQLASLSSELKRLSEQLHASIERFKL